jgi:hypothetical protein
MLTKLLAYPAACRAILEALHRKKCGQRPQQSSRPISELDRREVEQPNLCTEWKSTEPFDKELGSAQL